MKKSLPEQFNAQWEQGMPAFDPEYHRLQEQNQSDAMTDYDTYLRHCQERKAKEAKEKGLQLVKPGDELVEEKELSPVEFIMSRICYDPREALANAKGQKWLIDGIIPCDAFGVIYGPSGSYKSFLALDMAASISSGEKWHDIDVDMQGTVLYIAAEGAAGLLQRQVAWENRRKVASGPLAVVRMAVHVDDPVMSAAFVLAAEQVAEKLDSPPRLIVVDTMARSFSGEENSAKDVSAFISSLDRWRVKLGGCTVMVIAHTGKDISKGARGSSALRAACDFEYQVTKVGHLQSLLKCTKAKDCDEPPDMRFALDKVMLGTKDKKERDEFSLVPCLESVGDQADPDNEEESVFASRDQGQLVGMVRAAERNGDKITEDDLRNEFVGFRVSEGAKPDTIKRGFRRLLSGCLDKGVLMKHGKYISIGSVK